MQGIKKHIALFFLVIFSLWQGANLGHQHHESNHLDFHTSTDSGELSKDCFQCDATFYSQSELLIATHSFQVFSSSFIFKSLYNKGNITQIAFESSNKSPPYLG